MTKEEMAPETDRLTDLAKKILAETKSYTAFSPLGVEVDELIKVILETTESRFEPFRFLKTMLSGVESKQKITVATIDCKEIPKFEDLEFLASELLIYIAEQFCPVENMEDFLPKNQYFFDQRLSSKVIILLENLKNTLKLSKQLLLVKNLDALDKKMREEVVGVLKQLSSQGTCSTVVLG